MDGRLLYVNPALCEFFGYGAATLQAMTWHQLSPADQVDADLARGADLLVGRIDSYTTVKEHVRADGDLVWAETTASVIRDAEGRPECLIVHLVGVGAQMRADEEREVARRRQATSDTLYRCSMDSAAVGMCLADLAGNFVDVNQALCEFFGYDPAALKTKTWQELTAPEYLQADLDHREAVMAGQIDSYRMVKQFIHADGHRIWGDLAVGCVRTPDGQVELFIGQIIDITSEVRTREQLDAARRRQAATDALYRRSMDSAAVGMCLCDEEGTFLEVNPAICAFFGYDAATLKSKTWQELTAEGYLEIELPQRDELIAGRIESYRMAKQFIHADGTLIWGDLSVSCVRVADGTPEIFIGQIVDITAEMHTRDQLARSEQQNRVLAQRLSAEIDTAAAYVTSTLPGELHGPLTVSSSYQPSQELGGDCFNYTWLDDDLLQIYLIDVSGHGLGPALLSMSVHNLLRSGSLATTTMLRPGRVLAELNALFPMEAQGGNYFTIWYGIYDTSSRLLRYASGGHHPALAFITPDGGGSRRLAPLVASALPVGMFADTKFEAHTYTVPPGCRMLLFSDGAYEFTESDGTQFGFDGFAHLATELAAAEDFTADAVLKQLVARTAGGVFEDDCSLIAVDFG